MAELPTRIAKLSPAKQELLVRARGRASLASAESIRPRAQRDGCSLSFAQQRLWLIHQLHPDGYLYNVPRGLRFKGKLDIASLEAAINEIVRRHEVLRTAFPDDSGTPVQRIQPTLQISLVEIDLREITEEQRMSEVLRLALEEYRRPFNLETGPVIRARLWRLNEGDRVLLLVMHHIVSDAWSGGILFEELGTLYSAYLKSESSPLPDLPIQYADYAVWQRARLRGERLESELAYWEKELAGAPLMLDLPTDRPRDSAESFAGAVERIAVPPALLQDLQDLSRKEGVTLFMTLLAGFSVLLSRYTGKEDVVVGTDVGNRIHLETERLIGFFINLLPVRPRPSGNLSFRRLIVQVKEILLRAYAHQDFPFEKLVEALKPERTLTQNPIVQVLFVMQNTRRFKPEMAELETVEFELPVVTSRFDLGLFMEDREGALTGHWLYSTDLFEQARVLSMARHFENLLRAAVENPDARLSALEMRSEEERLKQEMESKSLRQSKSRKLMMTSPETVRI